MKTRGQEGAGGERSPVYTPPARPHTEQLEKTFFSQNSLKQIKQSLKTPFSGRGCYYVGVAFWGVSGRDDVMFVRPCVCTSLIVC